MRDGLASKSGFAGVPIGRLPFVLRPCLGTWTAEPRKQQSLDGDIMWLLLLPMLLTRPREWNSKGHALMPKLRSFQTPSHSAKD